MAYILTYDAPELLIDFYFESSYGGGYQKRNQMVMRTEPSDMEPKNTKLFVFKINKEFGLPEYLVQSISMPKFVNKQWSTIDIYMFDTFSYSSSKALMKLIEWSEKPENKNTLIEFVVDILDPVGVSVERWLIQFSDFNVEFSSLDYRYNDFTIHKLTVQPIQIYLN